MTSWFFVYRNNKDGKLKAVSSSSNNMQTDHPELEDVWCIATKAENEESAIKKAIELDNSEDIGDRILS